MKFLCDADRCIECNACVTACKNEHEVPWGINRRRVVTINDGKPGERSVSMACMHCTDAPCAAVCPTNVFYTTADGVVLHSKDLCIGCGYCFYACPFGAPQYPKVGNFGSRGKMDKCTYCAGGPEADALAGLGGGEAGWRDIASLVRQILLEAHVRGNYSWLDVPLGARMPSREQWEMTSCQTLPAGMCATSATRFAAVAAIEDPDGKRPIVSCDQQYRGGDA